jgi:alcohol dehydrogenase class IV
MNFTHFEYTSFPNKVFFGEGSFSTVAKLLANYDKAFVIAGERQAACVQQLIDELGKERVIHFSNIVQHVPVELVEQARQQQVQAQTNVLVAIGGGSAIGLAKALALQNEHDIIAVPTTYAGSEMTNIWGLTTTAGKTTGRDMKVLPKYVVYDPMFTANMPTSLAATSAMNAMAHLMEAVYAHDTNPITYGYALDGMRKLREGLELLATTKQMTIQINQLLQYGSFIAGKALCDVSMSLHHKLAHVLGGTFGLAHADVHTVLQAYVLEYQWDALSSSVQQDFKEALQHPYPPVALQTLAKNVKAPTQLKEIGFTEKDIDKAVDTVLAKPYANPKPITKAGLEQLLQNALGGMLKR